MNEHLIRRGLAELLHEVSGQGRFVPILGLLVVVAIGWQTMDWWAIVLVIGVHSLGTALSDRLRVKKIADLNDDEVAGWLNNYVRTSFINGLGWGFAGYLWINPAEPIQTAILMMLIFSVLFGSVISRAMHVPSLVSFEVPLFVGVLTCFVMLDPFIGSLLAGLGVLLFASVLLWGKTVHRNYREVIRLRYENAELIERLEQAKEQAEQDRDAAQAGVKTRDQFLAMINHEFRTPLNSIKLMSDELRRSKSMAEAEREYLEALRVSTDSLSVMLEDVLAMSTAPVYGAEPELEEQDFDVRRFARQLETIFQDKVKKAEIDFMVLVAEDVPKGLHGDESRIRQILFNLIGNAIRFTSAGYVNLSITKEEGSIIRFSVSDTGIGIPSDKQGRIFEPFWQADDAVREQFGGTGLGLAICDQLVRRMGGEIKVESHQGEGSRFWFDLSLEEAKGPLSDEYVLPTGEGIVLLAEDDMILAKVLKAGLVAAGYTTYHVATGEDALIHLEEGNVTHLVLDLGLPDRNGMEILEEIKDMPEVSSDLKTIVLSGLGDQETRARVEEAGVSRMLVKPVDLQDFLTALAS